MATTKPFAERIGFNNSKNRKLTKRYCKKPVTVRGAKGSPKRQAYELNQDPEVITSHFGKYRPHSFDQEMSPWSVDHLNRKYKRFVPDGVDAWVYLTSDAKGIVVTWDLDLVNVGG